MRDLMVLLIWVGGIGVMSNVYGFWWALFWPYMLGLKIASWVLMP
jgi:hypothetical protein